MYDLLRQLQEIVERLHEIIREAAPSRQGVDWPWSIQARLEAREETVATQHQKSHPEAMSDEDLRAKNAQALELVRKWLADESGYDERVFPVLKAELEADRLSYRRRFKE